MIDNIEHSVIKTRNYIEKAKDKTYVAVTNQTDARKVKLPISPKPVRSFLSHSRKHVG